MLCLTLLFLIVCGINKGIAEDSFCRTDNTCDCCNSNPTDGSRELSDICNRQSLLWKCTYGCKDGFYGGKCFNKCPEYCTRCALDFGNIKSDDFQICYLCADGYYNGTGVTNCSTPCPTNCAENQCGKTTGNCLKGCTSNNWSGDKCNVCADTWYGNNCDMNCSDNCHGNLCHMVDGKCMNGCEGNFAGDRCEMCKTNYYGINCDKSCTNCLNGICDRSTGICSDCDIGSFGDFCDNHCSLGCKSFVCDRYDATCSEGCKYGYSGDKCCVNNDKCEKCDSTATCTQCKLGHYGDSCSLECHKNCVGGCDKDSGGCYGCTNGYYGQTCAHICSTYCYEAECLMTGGACLSCKNGHYGPTCNNTCPDNCVNEICNQEDGMCLRCKTGYYGRSCNLECSLNCKDNICDQDTGSCTFGCVNEEENGCDQSTASTESLERKTNIMIGGMVGSFILIMIIIIAQWFILRRMSRRKSPEQNYVTPNRSKPDGENDDEAYENPDMYNDGEL
ncbi:hypothetical protein ACF0H5_024041 [Mactra antiquata]